MVILWIHRGLWGDFRKLTFEWVPRNLGVNWASNNRNPASYEGEIFRFPLGSPRQFIWWKKSWVSGQKSLIGMNSSIFLSCYILICIFGESEQGGSDSGRWGGVAIVWECLQASSKAATTNSKFRVSLLSPNGTKTKEVCLLERRLFSKLIFKNRTVFLHISSYVNWYVTDRQPSPSTIL